MRFVQQHASWLLFGFAVLVGGIWKFTPELTNHVYRTEGYKLLYQALEVLGTYFELSKCCGYNSQLNLRGALETKVKREDL